MEYVGQKYRGTTLLGIAVGQLPWGQQLFPFNFAVGEMGRVPEGFDRVGNGMSLMVRLPAHELSRVILFGFGSKGAQCVLLRTISVQPNLTAADASRQWEELFWFNAEPNMALDKFQRAIDQSVILAVRELQQEVTRSQS